MGAVRVTGGFDLKAYRWTGLRSRRPLASAGLVGARASGLIWDGLPRPRTSVWPCAQLFRFR
jgi:hypothetical protein